MYQVQIGRLLTEAQSQTCKGHWCFTEPTDETSTDQWSCTEPTEETCTCTDLYWSRTEPAKETCADPLCRSTDSTICGYVRSVRSIHDLMCLTCGLFPNIPSSRAPQNKYLSKKSSFFRCPHRMMAMKIRKLWIVDSKSFTGIFSIMIVARRLKFVGYNAVY